MRSENAPIKTITTTLEVTVLEMRRDTSLVQRITGEQTLLSREFPLSVDALVQQSLKHEPPWPIELEQAIELTEEALMPFRAICRSSRADFARPGCITYYQLAGGERHLAERAYPGRG